MLNDTTVNLISIANKKTIRKWVVCGVKYDFDHEWYSYHGFKLGDNEYCEFGTPFAAYKHAKNLVNKYRKTYSDAVVVIVEKVGE
jgi:hypothetical protein